MAGNRARGNHIYNFRFPDITLFSSLPLRRTADCRSFFHEIAIRNTTFSFEQVHFTSPVSLSDVERAGLAEVLCKVLDIAKDQPRAVETRHEALLLTCNLRHQIATCSSEVSTLTNFSLVYEGRENPYVHMTSTP